MESDCVEDRLNVSERDFSSEKLGVTERETLIDKLSEDVRDGDFDIVGSSDSVGVMLKVNVGVRIGVFVAVGSSDDDLEMESEYEIDGESLTDNDCESVNEAVGSLDVERVIELSWE